MPSSITHPRCPQALSLSSNHVNETYSVGSSSLHLSLPLAAVHPPGEVPSAGSSIQDNIPIAASNANIGTTSTEEDGLSLVQCRSRRIDVLMSSHYRQYDDVLPQPPPSVPSHIVQQTESIPVANSTSVLTTACTLLRPAPFCTARNVFGLVRQFFSSTPPSHDPEEAATLHDISSIPIPTPAGQDGPAEPHNLFHPYPNQTSFELGHWYWNGMAQKSHQSFKGLLNIIGCSDFDPNDVRHTHWDKINSKLGASVDEEDDEWLDEDAGWRKTEVTIKVPFSRITAQPGVQPYIAADLYHWSLILVICEKLANAEDVEHFHYEPYQLRWKPPHLPPEVNIQGELYTSPAFMEAHGTLQESPGEPGCNLPRVVTALMIWSDATQLTTFGNAKLWLVYMYFVNESKYCHCKLSHHLGNHVAYFQKLPDAFKDFRLMSMESSFSAATASNIGFNRAYLPIPQIIPKRSSLPLSGSSEDVPARDVSYREQGFIIWHYGVDSIAVETILKPDSWVPTSNAFLDTLAPFGFNIFVALVVDLLHEVELGVWHMLLVHLLRILTALDKDLINRLNERYRKVPSFGPAMIRLFSSNVSEMSNMAARNFEDLLQCSIPVFDGLLPVPHNKVLMNLLFTMSHWHGLAKLRMHSDITLKILDQQTTHLGEQFRHFKEKAKDAAKCNGNDLGRANEDNGKGKGKGKGKVIEQLQYLPAPKQPRRKKSFNIQTYKFYVLGDYVSSIRHFGTTNSYSTEPGELEHCTPKGRYHRTDRRTFVRQLTQIERRKTRLRCIKQRQQPASHAGVPEMANNPQLQHHIGQSEKMYDDFGQYLRDHKGDPAMRDFLPGLKTHILDRLEPETTQLPLERSALTDQHNTILFKRNQIYHHNLTRFNYTTYDIRRAQDVINTRTQHCNIMLLANHSDDGHYLYAKVIGIHHINIVRVANVANSRMGLTYFGPSSLPAAGTPERGFVDPGMVLRVCHIIPAFSQGQRNPGESGISPLVGDKHDWHEYYVNSFIDRDTLMRFHYGLGVGHVYSHEAGVVEMTVRTEHEPSESGGLMEHTHCQIPGDDEQDEDKDDDEDYVGVEEHGFFDQAVNASTESLMQALDKMFLAGHTFDYEN
ncbi:uncharacterized protein EDB93DRAFT_1247691 [Suillus bovinus]|uniref:uncharacterized protein n=1 Tax=Suillus bovinus TaxID=48563 RepID=UPI001B874249|nr:uncharacterized protein EDB93DRAFT_1247691 [Suillus bovinus]KAG2155200.1 hypothetical protein EDB93DRAFT_1247691 [Suillus bovinus]